MYDLARTAKKRVSRAPRSQSPGSGLRVQITEFEVKFLFYVFGITASVFRIRVSAFDYRDVEFRIRIPRWQFEFPRSSSFSAWLPTSRTTDNTISRDGRSAGVVSFGVPAYSRSGAHLSTTGLARAARNRAREIAIARPPLGRFQTGGARAERSRPLPNYAQMTIRLERSENELLRPLRACFPAVILTIARTGKSGMIPATPDGTVCVHYQTKPKMTQVARTAKKRTSFQELSESVSQQWASGSNYRISIPVSVLCIWISEFHFKNMAGRI